MNQKKKEKEVPKIPAEVQVVVNCESKEVPKKIPTRARLVVNVCEEYGTAGRNACVLVCSSGPEFNRTKIAQHPKEVQDYLQSLRESGKKEHHVNFIGGTGLAGLAPVLLLFAREDKTYPELDKELATHRLAIQKLLVDFADCYSETNIVPSDPTSSCADPGGALFCTDTNLSLLIFKQLCSAR